MKNQSADIIKVIIVDDSALIRAVLTEILESDDRIRVVAAAVDPYDARELIKKHNPDLITLDVEMPKMNGLSFLRNLMRLRPLPVVMISTLTQEGAPTTLEALALGAVDFFPKPKNTDASAISSYRAEICAKVRMAARANVRATPERNKDKKIIPSYVRPGRDGYLCAIGASTGGTEAIKHVLASMPENAPPIVIAQHIPAAFSGSFAKRLNSLCGVRVYEAEPNQEIEPGSVYIAPGHSHLRVERKGLGFVCKLGEDDPINRHRPSVDVLFDSVTRVVGKNSIGVLLTGMGLDGAAGLLRMKQEGAKTLIQNEASSVVWGMPGAAFELGAADEILDINKITQVICSDYFS